MTYPAASVLRSSVVRVCGRQQPVLRTLSVCPYSCGASSPFTAAPKAQPARRSFSVAIQKPSPSAASPRATVTLHIRSNARTASRRSLSTTLSQRAQTDAELDAAAASKAAATEAAAEAKAHPSQLPLDWNTFFKLRKTRRRWQLGFSVFMFATGGTAGALFLSTGLADPVVSQIPLDPFVTLGLLTFGFAGLGWLVGPSLGSGVFYVLKSQYRTQFAVKENQFFARIKKNRVDPSASSAGNPVPDFYGEKISSVAGYRQWLKDQRAFNKKRTTFV